LFLRLLISFFGVLISTPDLHASENTHTPAPIRFLLTFDDGPSAAKNNNPTELILATLENNPVQKNIKAIFFTQPRAVNGGATDFGQKLLRREFAEGHILAFHTATPRHTNHRSLNELDLIYSIQLGIQDLHEIMGKPPVFVRPPFWSYDAKTLGIYHQHNLNMLLTDLSANDGVIYFINFSLRKRSNLRTMLSKLIPQWRKHQLPSVDGVTPIIVTFHDVNTYTASRMEEYLEILMEVANELGVTVSSKAFYDDKEEMQRAALAKTIKDASTHTELPGIWNWLWN
jgi:peptidoglycan/xylan/chitin deacetylase (PgdA/CDA1 family)